MAGQPATAEGEPRRILILAGEASGDDHGGHVARLIRERWPGVELLGLGGPSMEAAGVRLLRPLHELAVMGFVEVLGRLAFFRRLEKELVALLADGDIDLVLPIDYPGLNLRMARHAKAAGIPVVYYIGPQVWAWKARRAALLSATADRIAVILPFEVPIYEAEGGRVEFVGHPLLDRDPVHPPPDFHERLGLDPERPLLALFPGSRRQELGRHLPVFTGAAEEVLSRDPSVQVAVGKAPTLPREHYSSVRFPLTEDGTSLRAVATAGLVKSGTSTLEAALDGMPFVMAYKTHPLTYVLAKRLVRVPHIALANLVAGSRVVPELIQGDAKPGPLADALMPLLREGSGERATMVEGLKSVRGALGQGGAARRVVELVDQVLQERAGAGR